MTRTSLFLVACLAVLCGRSLADTLQVGQRTWSGAKFLQVQDGKIRFTASDGSQQAASIPNVTRLEIDLRDDLNRAENLRVAAKVGEAVSAYEAALRTETRNDLGGYIRYRLMDLYDRTAQLERAVEMFLDLVKQPDFHAVAKDWRPANLAAVKPRVREAALTVLEDGLRQIKTGLASESIRELRGHIQAAKSAAPGAAPPPTATAVPAAGGAVPAPVPAPASTAAPASADSDVPAQPEPAENWPGQQALQAGQYAQALHAADQLLDQRDLSREQLAEALYVRGVARYNLAKDKAQLLEAGWALARLMVEFPSYARGPECQYYLGLVHLKLGQGPQGRSLLQQVQQNPGASAALKQKARKDLTGSDK